MKQELKVLLNIPFINFFYKTLKKVCVFFRKAFLASKAICVYLFWLMKEKKTLYRKMKLDYGIINIKPYNILHWKNGVKYFIVEYNGKKCFIKNGGIKGLVLREKIALNKMAKESDFLKEHIPILVNNDESDDFLIEEFIEKSKTKNVKELTFKEKQSAVIQIFNIYIELRKNKIKHLDIQPSNFIFVVDKSSIIVKIIDFAYALIDSCDIYMYIPNTQETFNIIKNVGSKYTLQNKTLDDAYSFLTVLKEIYPDLIKDYNDIWKYLNDNIGNDVVKIYEKKENK